MKVCLEAAKSFGDSEIIHFGYDDKTCDAFKQIVDDLEKRRQLLCEVSNQRLGGLEAVKPEIEQFNNVRLFA